MGAGLRGPIDDDGHEERPAPGHQVRTLLGEPPLEAEVALRAALRGRRDDRHEQRALPDLPPDGGIPGVTTAQLALVEPHLDAGAAQHVVNATGGLGVLRRVAEKNGFGRVGHGGWVERATLSPSPPRCQQRALVAHFHEDREGPGKPADHEGARRARPGQRGGLGARARCFPRSVGARGTGQCAHRSTRTPGSSTTGIGPAIQVVEEPRPVVLEDRREPPSPGRFGLAFPFGGATGASG